MSMFFHILPAQNPNDYAPACADEITGIVCPAGMFLRDKTSCVAIFDCNCYLPNGVPAPVSEQDQPNDVMV